MSAAVLFGVTAFAAWTGACGEPRPRGNATGTDAPAATPAGSSPSAAATNPASSPAPAGNPGGIDVSHDQQSVDWRAVKSAGVTFAFAKATDGDAFVDPQFAENWPAMLAAGVVRGAYHFFRPSMDAAAQARHFLQTVQLSAGDLPPVLDVEEHDATSSTPLSAAVQTWLTIVEQATGRRPIVYTNHEFWSAYMTDQFGDFPLWVAEYGVAEPRLPPGWSRWTFWQHSQNGTTSGVTQPVDLSVFNGSSAELTTFVRAP